MDTYRAGFAITKCKYGYVTQLSVTAPIVHWASSTVPRPVHTAYTTLGTYSIPVTHQAHSTWNDHTSLVREWERQDIIPDLVRHRPTGSLSRPSTSD
jgi:hypothetical protein